MRAYSHLGVLLNAVALQGNPKRVYSEVNLGVFHWAYFLVCT